MSAREELISELGFLDEAAVVAMDENPKGKPTAAKKGKWNPEVPDTKPDAAVLSAIKGLDDEAALAVLAAYRRIPKEVKSAVQAVYDALGGLGGTADMGGLKDALKALKGVCGGKYEGLYESAVKDAKRYVPKIQTRLLTEGMEEV